MSNTEFLRNNPYDDIPSGKRKYLRAVEVPAAFASFATKRTGHERIRPDTVQHLLDQATAYIGGLFRAEERDQPKIEGKIGEGFESVTFSFTAGDKKWIMKVGLPSGFTPGLYNPSTSKFAEMTRWNRSVLEHTFRERMPHLLLNPYFILSPADIGTTTTIQIAPYMERVTALSEEDRERLIQERLLFDKLSQQLKETAGAVPDLIGSSNLIVSTVNDQPHLVLLDYGLHNLQAPTPVLNRLATSVQRVSLVKDLIHLKRQR